MRCYGHIEKIYPLAEDMDRSLVAVRVIIMGAKWPSLTFDL